MIETIPPHADEHPVLDRIDQALRARRRVQGASFAQRRLAMEALQAQLRLPEGVEREETAACGVPALWLRPSQAPDDAPVVLYLHGGGYALGSLVTHRELMARLALAVSGPVLGIAYRLAPEHPYPAAVDDAVTAYRWLLARGVAPGRIVVAGDSAGGGLALATLLRLRDAGDPLPVGAVLFSPWTDLTAGGDSHTTRADRDVMVRPESLRETARAYAAGRLGEPEVSPLLADLHGLPPVLVQVGDAEVLLDDSTRLAGRLEEAGVTVRVEIWQRMLHVFQSFPQLPEAGQALERVGAWVRNLT